MTSELKFSFFEKATKIWSYHPLDLMSTISKCQIKWVITLKFFELFRKAELYKLLQTTYVLLSRQKLGSFLENKVLQKLKKWVPEMKFCNEKKRERFR